MSESVLVLSAAHRAALGAVRTLPGLQVAEASGGELWLRAPTTAAELPPAVRALPATARYALGAESQLFEFGRLTPTRRLPMLRWQPIAEFLPLEVPTAALPGQGAPTYRPRLVPATKAAVGAALLCRLTAWLAYAESAPASRLQPLRFAAAADGRVLVLGTPLPTLAGQEHWQRERLLLPAGFDLEAPLLAPLLPACLGAAPADLLLFAPDGSWELLPAAHLLPATRAAVRLTAAALRHE